MKPRTRQLLEGKWEGGSGRGAGEGVCLDGGSPAVQPQLHTLAGCVVWPP